MLVRIRPKALILIFSLAICCSKNDPVPSSCNLTFDGAATFTYTNNKWTGGILTNGKVPYTVEYDNKDRVSKINGDNTYTFEYDSVSQLKTDECYVPTSPTVPEYRETYTYNSTGQLIKYLWENVISEYPGFSYTITNTYSYPNTTTKNCSSLIQNTVIGTLNTLDTIAFQYDDKKNIYSSVPFYPATIFSGHQNSTFFSTGNNITQWIWSSAGNKPDTINVAITYNSAGYPTVANPGYGSYLKQSYSYACR